MVKQRGILGIKGIFHTEAEKGKTFRRADFYTQKLFGSTFFTLFVLLINKLVLLIRLQTKQIDEFTKEIS